VMVNLIENGVKYGHDNGCVYVGFEADKEQVTISVRDDGPGITSEHLRRIFERFYRVEKSRSKDKGGSGLGLAIVKHIVEAHASKVSVVSKVGKGTVFSFKLKRARLGDPAPTTGQLSLGYTPPQAVAAALASTSPSQTSLPMGNIAAKPLG
jgi:two-component system, OmpR family, phosphate regulon sensor histidine kinase PhoR